MTSTEINDDVGHHLFRNVADIAFNAITVTRAGGDDGPSEIVYVNDAFTRMTGYESDEVLGHTPGMLQGPKTDRAVLDELDLKLARGETFHGQTVNYRKDGSEFTIEWKVTPVVVDGRTTHYLAVQRDISNGQVAA
jgi:PAS domain S-box-containing protein